MYITMEEIERLIGEDVPYFDLTSHVLGIGGQMGKITYFTRQDTVVCGTEEVELIFRRLDIRTERFLPSGSTARAGAELICGLGRAEDLQIAWKVSQNILDHCCAVAAKTRALVEAAQQVRPGLPILTTRKGFPGTKKLAVKAVLAGGGLPHRLGISETVLIFKQHLQFIGGLAALLEKMPQLKAECCEKKIIVEAENYADALRLCQAGVDGIQFDKLPPAALKEAAALLKQEFPQVTLLAAGGVNEQNAAEYAAAQVDGLVTTSVYSAKPIDIGVKMELIC